MIAINVVPITIIDNDFDMGWKRKKEFLQD